MAIDSCRLFCTKIFIDIHIYKPPVHIVSFATVVMLYILENCYDIDNDRRICDNPSLHERSAAQWLPFLCLALDSVQNVAAFPHHPNYVFSLSPSLPHRPLSLSPPTPPPPPIKSGASTHAHRHVCTPPPPQHLSSLFSSLSSSLEFFYSTLLLWASIIFPNGIARSNSRVDLK